MWAVGLAAFAATYSISVVVGAFGHAMGMDAIAAVPLAGPFIAAATCDTCSSAGKTAVTFLGVVQVVGVGLLISGLIVRQKRFVRIKRHALRVGATWAAFDIPSLSLRGEL